MTERPTGLEGNGALLIRERNLARAVQQGLERLYQIDCVAPVEDFVEPAGEGERETLFVKEAADGSIELALRLPALGRPAFDLGNDGDMDPLCQLIEGVSHFVYVTHRASGQRGVTQLELEMQAEIDKFVVLAASLQDLDARSSARLRTRLYDRIDFTDDETTEVGARYRTANAFAARLTARLEHRFIRPQRFSELRNELRRLFRLGQEEKFRAAFAL